MRLISVSYYDKIHNWGFNDFRPNDSLTMLVGASGVGKTKILKAIETIANISYRNNKESFRGLEWKIEFETYDGAGVVWSGKFDDKIDVDSLMRNSGEENYKILEERIEYNGNITLTRDEDNIQYNGDIVAKLDKYSSVVRLMSVLEMLDIRISMIKIIKCEEDDLNYLKFFSSDRRKSYEDVDIKSIDVIRNYYFNVFLALFFASSKNLEIVNEIKDRFIEIFPMVEDLKIEILNEAYPGYVIDTPVIKIKEYGVDNWILHNEFSNGMMKTLYYLCKLAFCPDGSVVMIDEIENGLGVNCIGDLADEIISNERQLQLIITSHHPYIINNIDMKYWTLVTRKAGEVKMHNDVVKQYCLGDSAHDNFMQLLQLPQFRTGRE